MDPTAVKQLLSTLLGTRLVVEKTREILLINQVRVHLDQVNGLGTFIELEAEFEVDTAEAREKELRKVADLVQSFGINKADLQTSGYMDLMEKKRWGQDWTLGDITISSDSADVDLELVHAELKKSYWSAGIPKELVEESVRNSLCFSAFDSRVGKQIGFARVVSDYSTFAYLGDVFVVTEYRRKGVSKFLMECILAHPRLQGLRRFCLGTRDAHELYRTYGFEVIQGPENWMEIKNLSPYMRHSNRPPVASAFQDKLASTSEPTGPND